MGSGFSSLLNNEAREYTRIKDGKKAIDMKFLQRKRVPPNLRVPQCGTRCKNHPQELIYVYHFAAAHASSAIFTYLLTLSNLKDEYMASVDLRTPSKKTPLMYAVLHGKCENVNTLIATMACDVNIKDVDGNTALHFAANLGYLNIVKELINSEDININPLNRYGNRPLDEALHYNRKEVVNFLESKFPDLCSPENSRVLFRRSRLSNYTFDSGLQITPKHASSSMNGSSEGHDKNSHIKQHLQPGSLSSACPSVDLSLVDEIIRNELTHSGDKSLVENDKEKQLSEEKFPKSDDVTHKNDDVVHDNNTNNTHIQAQPEIEVSKIEVTSNSDQYYTQRTLTETSDLAFIDSTPSLTDGCQTVVTADVHAVDIE